MTRQILHRWTGAVLWEGEAETVKDALHAALESDADLTGAVLTGAVLTDADLTGAVLRGADLTGAVLTDADLTPIRDDVWAVLSSSPAEVPTLLAKLRAGEVDGSCYEGECCCLVGTLAKARGCDYDAIPGLTPSSVRPAEVFFAAIRKGQTPANHAPARIAAEWIEDWLTRMRSAFAAA